MKEIIQNISFLLIFCGVGISADSQNVIDSTLNISCIQEVASCTFQERNDIKTVIFSNSLKSIGIQSFYKCHNIENIVIPDGCISILDRAFEDCISLKTIEIPSSVTCLGANFIPLDVLMVVEKGSKAEKYAKKHNIDYVYDRVPNQSDVSDVVGPILKTCWDQPMDYFYSKEKYGKNSNKRGLCECVAWGQILKHLNLNVYGSRKYVTKVRKYYRDFDSNHTDIDNLPVYISSLPSIDMDSAQVISYKRDSIKNVELYNFLENIAFAIEHGWRNEEVISKQLFSICEHTPISIIKYNINDKRKTSVETIIRERLMDNIPLFAVVDNLEGTDHAVVIDGIRKKNGKTEVHIDFGWGGNQNRWTELCATIKIAIDNHKQWMSKRGVIYIYDVIPLEGEELKKWKPYRVK